MTIDRLIEIYNEKVSVEKSISVDIAHNKHLTSFIIDILLPAIRDHKEFQDGFWEWMVKMGYAEYIEFMPEGDERDFFLCHKMFTLRRTHTSKQMLLGYELEYYRTLNKEV